MEPWEEWRSDAQNSLLQPACRDLSRCLTWESNGQMVHLSPDEFRWLLCADVLGQRPVRGVHSGVVMLGGSSRNLTKRECADVITLAFSIGDCPELYELHGQKRVEWCRVICAARGISPNDDVMAERYGQ